MREVLLVRVVPEPAVFEASEGVGEFNDPGGGLNDRYIIVGKL